MQLAGVLVLILATASPDPPAVTPGQCGYDRWPVKVFTDQDRALVDLQPVTTTVGALAQIRVPEVPYPYDHRLSPQELQVFRVRARLLQVRAEADRDLHLQIADPDDEHITMIAEIPAPECARGSNHEADYQAARDTLSRISNNAIIQIDGIGFFDFIHPHQVGHINGFELHPVLRLQPESPAR